MVASEVTRMNKTNKYRSLSSLFDTPTMSLMQPYSPLMQHKRPYVGSGVVSYRGVDRVHKGTDDDAMGMREYKLTLWHCSVLSLLLELRFCYKGLWGSCGYQVSS